MTSKVTIVSSIYKDQHTICAQVSLACSRGTNMITLSLQDIRFLLSRSRGEWLPEELNGVAPLGPTGIRHVEGFGNNTTNMLAPNWWNGAADMLFPRMTFNRLNDVLKKGDVMHLGIEGLGEQTQKVVAFKRKA